MGWDTAGTRPITTSTVYTEGKKDNYLERPANSVPELDMVPPISRIARPNHWPFSATSGGAGHRFTFVLDGSLVVGDLKKERVTPVSIRWGLLNHWRRLSVGYLSNDKRHLTSN
jgi:hypothetical protein